MSSLVPVFTLLLLLLTTLPAPAWAEASDQSVPPFSAMTSLDDGWAPLEFPSIDKLSHYMLVDEDGVQMVQAETDGGASGLIARVSIVPGDRLILRWRWKVSGVYKAGNARKKSGDDYPARIYVAFQFDPDSAGFFERAKRKTAELLYGDALPGNALNYIWANKLPVDEIVTNPFTEQTMMIAVTSGDEEAGQWVTVERDIVADYKAAFGEAPPEIMGIGIMSDSDNTGESATAWYGDIVVERQ
ncbi:DUF3047 domain-containing protein [Marinobacter sp. 1Y8]